MFTIQDTTPPALTVPAAPYYDDCDQAAASIAAFLANRSGAQAVDVAGPVTWTHNYNGTLPDCMAYITVTFTATDTLGLGVSTSARFFLFPPGAIWIGPATGTWDTPTAWRTQIPTAALDTYIDLFDFQNTSVNSLPGATVKNLFVGAGDMLTITNGASSANLQTNGNTIRNAGTIRLSTLTSGVSSALNIRGATNLTGAGKIILSGPGRNVIERGNGLATDALTVAAGQEITTTAGTIAESQKTSINAGLINHGTLTADQGGIDLGIISKTNNGTFRAIHGGTLRVSALTNYNAATSTLTGGSWEVISAGTPTLLDIPGSPIATLAAGTTVRLSGAGASFPQLSGLTNITGTLALENGKAQTTTGNLAIPGVLQYGLPAALETTRLAITGNVHFTGTRIDVTDLGLTAGNYLLATWTGTHTGTPVLGSLPPGSQHTLVLNAAAKTLRLQVVIIQQVDITIFTIAPGTGPNAGQNVVTLAGTGQANAGYVVQATTDLQNWTALSGVLTSPTGAPTWQFTEPATLSRRCYRFLPQ